jgi:hypothetical protein
MTAKVGQVFVAAAAAITLTLVPASTASAATRNNAAVAFTNAHHNIDIDVSFRVTHDKGPVVNANNLAFATGSDCTGCRTIAVAIQIDLVSGVVTNVNAQNFSTAKNVDCVECETLAFANQFVVAPGGEDVELTQQGGAELVAIRSQLMGDVGSGEPIPELQADLDALMSEINTVLGTEVRSGGSDPGNTVVYHRDTTSHATLYNEDQEG